MTGAADPNANVIFGAVIDEALGERVRVTVIATGFDGRYRRERERAEQPQPSPERPRQTFDLPSDVLEVPTFLRE